MIDDILVAGPVDVMTRLSMLGDRGTAGPDDEWLGGPVRHPLAAAWSNGWWRAAAQRLAHPGRAGHAIQPFAVVAHTTDMLPEEWDALVAAWQTRPGDGACAHFLIGRDVDHGVIQLIPITRNANHAGGPPGHGVFRTESPKGTPPIAHCGRDLHPNLVSVGIELHCAGGVRRIDGAWRLVEDGKAHGAPLPDADVTSDPQRPGRGWHHVTDYQRERFAALLGDLEDVLLPVPAGTVKVAFGETPPAYAVLPGARIATHAELDPKNRADPWPPLCDWLRARASR